ncbi:MAG: hypothetical protein R3C13_12520 [Hyphomonas sp.]|uniref:hypothetical protein n=1 Tax=Hyphomonas sp. TaxID=87 RepID=UPI003527C7E1
MKAIEASLVSTLGKRSLLPAGVAFAPRVDVAQLRFLGVPASAADTVSTTMMGGMNGRVTVRHKGCATSETLGMIARSGIEVAEDMRTFSTPEEAYRHARSLVREGHKLAWPYPPRKGRYPEAANYVSPRLWRKLNSKRNLPLIVPSEYLADRSIISMDTESIPDIPVPCYIKSGGDMPTGMGYAVRYCESRDEVRAAWDFFKSLDGVDEIIVEEAVSVRGCWCVSLSIEETGVRYLGAAEQLFSSPARQIGNIIDDDDPFPMEGVKAAIEIGENAKTMGFRGPAGMDIGVSEDGRIVVFDPNFRPQGSTQQTLFHPAAAKRGRFRASRSLNVNSGLNISDAERALRRHIDSGRLVIYRAIDGREMPSVPDASVVTGFVMGEDREDANRWHATITKCLG